MTKSEQELGWIRNDWFKTHVAKFDETTFSDGTKILRLDWRRPGEVWYWVRYIISGRFLMVCGDIGEAVYEWSENLTWEFLAGCDSHYFASKCMASECGRGGRTWDSEVAEYNLQDNINRWAADEELTPITVQRSYQIMTGWDCDPTDFLSSSHAFYATIQEHGSIPYAEPTTDEDTGKEIEHEMQDVYELGNLGEVIHIRISGHLEGIKMAWAQQKAQKAA